MIMNKMIGEFITARKKTFGFLRNAEASINAPSIVSNSKMFSELMCRCSRTTYYKEANLTYKISMTH